MMPYLAATPGFSSTLSLTIFTLPLSELEISSNAGAIMRQGPHHSAQKSTTTGPLALSTSLSKVASVTFSTMEYLVFAGVVGSGIGCRIDCPESEAVAGQRMEATARRQAALTGA